MIYNSLSAATQWETPEECFDDGMGELDADEIFSELQDCVNFRVTDIVHLIAEHLPDLFEEASRLAMATWVDCMESDKDDEEILSEFKSDYYTWRG